MEQVVLSNKNRFGRSSEKLAVPEQIRFMEVDGQIVFFNEAEATCDLNAPEPDDLEFREPKKNLRIAGCWGHCRRKFHEALEIIPKDLRFYI